MGDSDPSGRKKRSLEDAQNGGRESGKRAKTDTERAEEDALSDAETEVISDSEDERFIARAKAATHSLRVGSATAPDHPQSPTLVDCGIRLTRVLDAPLEDNRGCPSLRDILAHAPPNATLTSMMQINYMVDLEFVMSHLPPTARSIPILVAHGFRGESREALMLQSRSYANVTVVAPDVPMFGTHHTKCMVFFYSDESMRVVVHTANMIHKDWKNKTQSAWFSPFLPKKSASTPSSPADGFTSQFERDWVGYFNTYKIAEMGEWKRKMREYEYASCKAVLIATVPGRFLGDERWKWGYMRLRKVLGERVEISQGCASGSEVICQFSSIGSLGPTLSSYFTPELSTTFLSTSTRPALKPFPPVRLVFPTSRDVRESYEGYEAGDSIPHSEDNWGKQGKWMKGMMCKWQSEKQGRARAMPHIKTYTRVNPATGDMSWLLVTSANMSKAAWGNAEKDGRQLNMKSYELGVLVYPGLFKTSPEDIVTLQNVPSGSPLLSFPAIPSGVPPVPPASTASATSPSTTAIVPVRLPYDLPLTPYPGDDEPWIWDRSYKEEDSLGKKRGAVKLH